MTGEELYERILTAGPPSTDLQVLLSFKQENGGHYHRRLPMSQRLTEHFQAFLSGFLQAQRGKLQRGTTRILEHDPAYKPDKNEITWAEKDDVPFLAAFLDELPDPHEIDAYDSEDEKLLQTMSFFTIETRLSDDSDLRAFCRITKSKEITRGGIKRIPITWVTNRFDTLEDTTLVFEPRFFAFEYEEHMFILTQHYLEQAFGYIERIRNVAEAALNEIEEKVPIANFGEFREASLRHPNKIRKLRQIYMRPYLERLTVDQIEDEVFSRLEPEVIGVGVRGEGDTRELVYDPDNPWGLLNLLSDKFVEGLLSQTVLEANSTRQLERG